MIDNLTRAVSEIQEEKAQKLDDSFKNAEELMMLLVDLAMRVEMLEVMGGTN